VASDTAQPVVQVSSEVTVQEPATEQQAQVVEPKTKATKKGAKKE